MSTDAKAITCKAALLHGVDEPLVIEEIQVSPPQELEVRIQIYYSALCHTDFSVWRGKIGVGAAFPRILGHEAAGVVESVGEGVTHVKPGDHVIPLFQGECQDCQFCQSDKTNMCEKFYTNITDGIRTASGTFETRFSWNGKPVNHCFGTSTFSQYTVVSYGCVVKLNPEAPLDKVCLLGCGVGTGLGAAWKSAKVHAGSTVAIFGLGTVGLAVAEGARVAGASRIIGVDVNPEKAATGRVFGVTDFVNPKDHDKPIQQVIAQMTNGGVDYAFECVGIIDLMLAAYESTHHGWGVAVIVGVASAAHPISFNYELLFTGRIIKGTVYGDLKGRSDVPGLVDKYLRKEYNLDDFVTHNFSLSQINDAFELMKQGTGLRSVIRLVE